MKRVLAGLTVVVGFLLASGCMPLKKIEPGFKLEKRGFEFIAPQDDVWYMVDEAKTGSAMTVFAKEQQSKTHTVRSWIIYGDNKEKIGSPEDLLTLVETFAGTGGEPDRQTLVKKEVVLDKKFGDYSVSAITQHKDPHAPNRGASDYLLLNNYVYYILHPESLDFGISICYSERGLPAEVEDPGFTERAEKFLAGFSLKPLD